MDADIEIPDDTEMTEFEVAFVQQLSRIAHATEAATGILVQMYCMDDECNDSEDVDDNENAVQEFLDSLDQDVG